MYCAVGFPNIQFVNISQNLIIIINIVNVIKLALIINNLTSSLYFKMK